MAVTPEIVAVALGRTAPTDGTPERAQWSMWIADALMLIEARLGDPTLLDQAKLDYVVREAVVAHVRKPDDATEVRVSVDDASSARVYRTSKGRVTILDEWWSLLMPNDDGEGAFTIDMLGSSDLHLPWCALNFGALYCSCGVDVAGYPIFEPGY